MNFDGFYLVDKQPDWTSFDVCARMRRMFSTKKIGHTGTLDPFATGLLIVAVGKCTRLIPFLVRAKKTYRAKFVFGKSSPTLDPESEISEVSTPKIPTREEFQKVLEQNFTGKISQIPPEFSAIKISGKKCCDLARAGKKVEIPPRATEVFRIKILDFSWPEVSLELEVAAGFYVRALARDLGKNFKTAAICTELRRTFIEKISVADALPLEKCATPIDPKFILTKLSKIEIPAGRTQDFVAGRAFPWSGLEGDKFLVLVGGRTIGLGEICAGKLQPRVVL
ncbi:tRNA pseudouridine(55) synthase TruB [bacterium]|jgi:tRNA pseudouridine55 synthase|nr:tRNA pseudouridine(55) synthase TruB [bacterium]MBT6831788.1 tRNA pseudouridine(55) synthase TruB [bacterium]MBT6995995.1 tRNA pseudouridine(55) synthase TruB [bacterium]MBT7772634.1 tRNA pseudouridine(55) synthase TruB [bacterium]